MDSATYHRFWAKTPPGDAGAETFHLLPYHNLDVAAVGERLLREAPLLLSRLAGRLDMGEEATTMLVRTLLALHDVGKFSERFQSLQPKIASDLGGPVTDRDYVVYHDTLGFGAWRDFLFSALWEDGSLGLEPRHGDRWDWAEYFEVLMKPVTGHHGSPPIPEKTAKVGPQFCEQSEQAAIGFAREVARLLYEESALDGWEYSRVEAARRASWLLAGLTVAADWLGSDMDKFAYETRPIPLRRYFEERARPQAKEALAEAGLTPPKVSADTGLRALFPDFVPTPMQRYASEVPMGEGPMLFILEDVTGSGKTESAATIAHRLMAAGKAEGLYVGLPTMATANAMYERLAGAYRRLFAEPQEASLALAHSARDLSEPFQDSVGLEQTASHPGRSEGGEAGNGRLTGEAQCAAWLADGRKKALLAHVGVGTVDQALLGALPSDHQSLRLLGLGRSVLIVDEVHAYDSYMQRLLEGLLRFQAALGGSAILLSATLPQTLRQSFADAFCEGVGTQSPDLSSEAFPLATHIAPEEQDASAPLSGPETAVNEEALCLKGAKIRQGYHRDVKVSLIHSKEDVIDRLVGEARDGGCACWIRNTVSDARDGWEDVRGRFEETEGLDRGRVGLFHARFCLSDRQEIEDRVLRRFGKESGPEERAGRVLVTTQVVEQSLDLDFDYMVTDLSPIDLIVQRAGREQRHLRAADGSPLDTEENGDLEDGRERTELGVFGPPPVSDPSASWYVSYFPKAVYVYPDVGTLWRTARKLEEKGRIRVPQEARELIEGVYGEEAEPIPEALEEATKEAREERRKNRSVATGNVLHLDGGYGASADQGQWTSEDRAPTRLGEPTTTVRLGQVEDGEIVPWAHDDDDADEDTENAWRESELRVRSSMIAAAPARSKARRKAVAQAEETMPDGGQWSVLVVLEEDVLEEDAAAEETPKWVGRAQDDEGTPVEIRYSPITGLHVDELSG